MKSPRFSVSRLVWIITIIISILYYGKIGKDAYNFYGDALGYYMYLPNTFIYHNHKSIERLPEDREIRPFIHTYVKQIGGGQRTPKGYVLNQYTYGVALMEAPFFFLAHTWETLRGSKANGFSQSYRLAVTVSCIMYGLLGLCFTFRVLRRRFSYEIASCTTALLLLGTNLFWFIFQQQGMSHVPLFFLFALLLYLTDLIYTTGKWKHFIGLGFVMGLITVIRPIDGICVLIPLLYAEGKPFFKTKLDFITRHYAKILVAGLCFLVPVIPQLLYWKWLTGYSIYDSYGPNQKFDFVHPHFLQGLFGASNGWLFYTPLMAMALLGMFFIRKLQPFAAGCWAFVLLYSWAVYSWFLPNYPNGLGSRPMVDMYPLLAIPLAIVLQAVWEKGKLIRALVILFIILSIGLNINYSIKQATGTLRSDDSKYAFNLSTLFHYHLSYNDLVVWDLGICQPNENKLNVVNSYCAPKVDSALASHFILDTSKKGDRIFLMSEGQEYGSPVIEFQSVELNRQKIKWIRCTGRFMATLPEYDIYQNPMMVLQIKRGDEFPAWHGVRILNKVGLMEDPAKEAQLSLFRDNVWGKVSFLVPVPAGLRDDDKIKFDVWNIGKKPLYISNMCVQLLK